MGYANFKLYFQTLISPDPKLCAVGGNIDYSSDIPSSSPKPLLVPVLLPLFET